MARDSAPVASDPLPVVQALYRLVPQQRLAAILARCGRASQRRRRLPAESVAWRVIAMALRAADSIPKVGRRLHPTRDAPEPDDSASTQARRRLGVAPRRRLSPEIAHPMATHQTAGASYRGGRRRGLDGTTLDLPDTPEDARTCGRPTTGRAEGACPQGRLLAPCEVGTPAACGRALQPLGHGAPSMVGPRLDHLGPGLLRIGDRGPFSFELITAVLRRGAHLLARVQSNTVLRPIRRLADGSYLAQLYPGAADRRHAMRGLLVRVVEYAHDDPNRPGMGERHRRITDLTDPEEVPAHEAPPIYHGRGEEALAVGEIKTHLSSRAIPIRSQTPAGVVQEISGLVLAPSVVRRVLHDAAVVAGQAPDRLSFLDSRRVLPCPWPESPQVATETWDQRLLREVRRQKRRRRRDRWYPRVIKRKRSNWTKKRPEHRNPPQPTKPFREAVVLLI